ncbi:MAG: putative Glutathione S-transferase [Polyangiaceae bacterium]|jgi:glutathione S-transferase|nr:putative Glutathione S-transferase [Polyangiaceae bacterium]
MRKMSFCPRLASAIDSGMKLHRFRYSPYARKVQAVLDWLGHRYELCEVPYADRNELAALTGGYIQVPVLVTDGGQVLKESRDICEHLVQGGGAALVPSPFEGPIWAYHDFADGPLEDVLFRIGSPAVQRAWPTPGERALYTFIKERKFGAGCVDAWLRERGSLVSRAQKLLAPSVRTLSQQPFLFGDTPTLADAALLGNCLMLQEGDVSLLPRIAPELVNYTERASAFRFREV